MHDIVLLFYSDDFTILSYNFTFISSVSKKYAKKDKIVLTVRAVLMLSYYKKRREKTNIKEVSYE
ncbi:hypothetical protein CLOSTHATH_03258 [Hungatella hathewayi DSM 13479]|uniref:Uncharacterized protein n=1 Tax=Hungatella hathewayi DSM 13479 TaxID=566550 RepID=D3AI20_9FIRM|nr:hypothetical protein CLOSTHATH_03258 [Hungatella hathewayi DSM 13479]